MRLSVGAVLCLLAPATTWAQGTGAAGIAGVVKDASGAVLPGVTVEAASPALIEKVRTTVTDSQGAYRIIELRPGVRRIIHSATRRSGGRSGLRTNFTRR
jgi:hypothetical protein